MFDVFQNKKSKGIVENLYNNQLLLVGMMEKKVGRIRSYV